jgi:large subunit ribosomal protein L28
MKLGIYKGYMMNICELTGKGKQYGSNVSFSQRHTKKVWKPNLQTKTVVVDGKKVTLKISTQAIRTLKKKGLLSSTGTTVTAKA